MELMSAEPLDVQISRLPFFLRPDLRADTAFDKQATQAVVCSREAAAPGTWGESIDKYTQKHPEKFGGEGQAPDARCGLSWQAAEVGLKFVFNQQLTPSMDSLRLLMKVTPANPTCKTL
eukprot:2837234-Amphidinium_carterae.1